MTPFDLDAALRERAAAWCGENSNGCMNAAATAALAKSEGIDFATAVLHEQVLQSGSNADFLRRAQAAAADHATSLAVDMIGVVPGAFHRQHSHTGADGARILRIARELGYAAQKIPVGDCGTLEKNAYLIRNWLASHSGKRIALLSLSKGSADVKHALAHSASAFADVRAWVSFSGMVQGTPLIRWLQRNPLRWLCIHALMWWHKASMRALKELDHGRGTILEPWPTIPETMHVVHVYGFPLIRHLAHRWAPKAHKRLASLGPNDGGGVLLSDVANLPGTICPIWAADHYLAPAWDAHSLLRGIVSEAVATGELRHASQSEKIPSSIPATRSSA